MRKFCAANMNRLAFLLLLLGSPALALEVTYCTDANVMSPCFTIMVPDTVCPVCPAPLPPPVVTPPPPSTTNDAALVWDPVGGATVYRVYWGTASGVYNQVRGAGILTANTTFTVTGLAPLVRYFFVVTASDGVGESPFSNEVLKDIVTSTPPPVVDTTPPSVPTGLIAVAISSTKIVLTWNPSTDNSGVVAGYYVYNANTGGTVSTRVGTTFTHTVAAGTTHTYRVSAYDAAVPINHSPWTDPPVSATTPLK